MDVTVERILMDEDELLDLELDTAPPNKTRAPADHKINLELVEEACSFLSDKCVSVSARPFFKTVSRAAVLKVDFLNTCVVAKAKFTHSCREHAWSKYNHAYIQHMVDVTQLTGSAAASAWLCMHLFQLLLDAAYPLASKSNFEEKARKCLRLKEGTKDAVQYIGGSIVSKLRQKAASLKATAAKEALIDCLCEMCDEEGIQNCSDNRMTKTLNRGGLVFLKPAAMDFFHCLEIEVQEACYAPSNKTQMKISDFVERCEADETVTSAFHLVTYNTRSEVEKESVFVKIVQLFYKIRVHHECKMFMQRLKCKTAVGKQGIRKRLKEKNTAPELQLD